MLSWIFPFEFHSKKDEGDSRRRLMRDPVRPLCVFLFVLTLSSPWPYAKQGFVKVVLERTDPKAAAEPAERALSRLGAQALKSYPAFTVVRVPADRRNEIEAVAREAGLRASVQDDWDSVIMPGFIVDTRAPRLP